MRRQRKSLRRLAAGRDVFAYFKHEETPEGVLYAVDVLQGSADAKSEA